MSKFLSCHSQLKGEYKLVLNGGTEREWATNWIPNLVLDAGLDRIGSSSGGMFTNCAVGTGTTTPAVSQTSLVTQIAFTAKTSSTAVNLGSTTYAGQYTAIYTFAQGAVVGNIAEMGVGWDSTVHLFSRSLIVDGSGTPTTITVVSLDQLTVYYRLTNIPVITDLSSSVTLSAVSYPYVGRLANATAFFSSILSFETWPPLIYSASPSNAAYPASSTIGAITSTPSGTGLDLFGMTISAASYTNGNFYRESTITVGPTLGNASGGIGALLIVFGNSGFPANSGTWQFAFSTPIPKDNTKTLTLTLRYSWGR